MPSVARSARLVGIGVVVLGVLVAGWGLYQDYGAPPCPGPIQPPDDGAVSAGGCEEPGLVKQFVGVGITVVGAVLSGVAHVVTWRRDTRPA